MTATTPAKIELQLDMQLAVENDNNLPTEEQLTLWATTALLNRTEYEEPEMTIRIVAVSYTHLTLPTSDLV